MEKCSKCNSDDILVSESVEVLMEYDESETRTVQFPIRTEKFLCMNCGNVLEVVKKEDLEKYQKLYLK